MLFLPRQSLKKPSEEIVRELIYFTNGVKFDSRDVTFGAPEVYPIAGFDTIERNTRLTVSPGNISGFSGDRIVFYRRLDLKDITPVSLNSITIFELPVSTHQLLDQINLRYGLSLSVDDVQDVMYPSTQGPFPLIAKASSLVWIGEYSLPLSFPAINLLGPNLEGFTRVPRHLDRLLPVKDLHGFTRHKELEYLLDHKELLGFEAVPMSLSIRSALTGFS